MSRDRFVDIIHFFHFTDNEDDPDEDRLRKLCFVSGDLREMFSTFFKPLQNIVIDESLLFFRGRFVFKQYIPSKTAQFGIKYFVICDCELRYCLDLVIYTGTDDDINTHDPLGFSAAVVKKIGG